MVDQHAEGAFAHIVKRDMDERIALVLFDGRGLRDLLEVVPERAAPQTHGDRRKAAHRHVPVSYTHLKLAQLIPPLAEIVENEPKKLNLDIPESFYAYTVIAPFYMGLLI